MVNTISLDGLIPWSERWDTAVRQPPSSPSPLRESCTVPEQLRGIRSQHRSQHNFNLGFFAAKIGPFPFILHRVHARRHRAEAKPPEDDASRSQAIVMYCTPKPLAIVYNRFSTCKRFRLAAKWADEMCPVDQKGQKILIPSPRPGLHTV